MKLVRCDGKVLQVRDVGPVIVEFRTTIVPLKPCGWQLLADDDARALVRETINYGLYERVV